MTTDATAIEVEVSPRPAIRDLIWDLRPESWEALCGNRDVIARLMGYCVTGMPPKQMLLLGPPGCGKTTAALLMAKSMACSGRADGDPSPCGACDSCREFRGSVSSNSTVYLDPQTTPHEFAQDRQQRLKRLMDLHWQGFMIACSTNPDKIEKALRSRFHRLVIEPPKIEEVVEWAGRMAARAGVEVADGAALRVLAMRGACNFRSVLSILQPLKDLGRSLDVRSVEDAARKAGYA